VATRAVRRAEHTPKADKLPVCLSVLGYGGKNSSVFQQRPVPRRTLPGGTETRIARNPDPGRQL